MVLDHYEDLDARYKAVIPLKRMYVPQPLPEDETALGMAICNIVPAQEPKVFLGNPI